MGTSWKVPESLPSVRMFVADNCARIIPALGPLFRNRLAARTPEVSTLKMANIDMKNIVIASMTSINVKATAPSAANVFSLSSQEGEGGGEEARCANRAFIACPPPPAVPSQCQDESTELLR